MVELRDRAGPGVAREDAAPRRLDVVAEWRDGTKSRDDDPASPVE
jgi:hypothetical protein